MQLRYFSPRRNASESSRIDLSSLLPANLRSSLPQSSVTSRDSPDVDQSPAIHHEDTDGSTILYLHINVRVCRSVSSGQAIITSHRHSPMRIYYPYELHGSLLGATSFHMHKQYVWHGMACYMHVYTMYVKQCKVCCLVMRHPPQSGLPDLCACAHLHLLLRKDKLLFRHIQYKLKIFILRVAPPPFPLMHYYR